MPHRTVAWLPLLLTLTVPATMPAGAARAQNIVTNGSFETPDISGDANGVVNVPGETMLDGWTVASGNLEIIHNTYWQAAAGNQSLDMNGVGSGLGAIFQDLVTTPGGMYDLFFSLAGNPNLPSNKTLDVLWGPASGALNVIGSFTFLQAGNTRSSMGWESLSVNDLTASTASTRLMFQSTVSGDAGPALDNVSVMAQATTPPPVAAVPEPASLLLLATGLAGIGAARARLRRRGRNVQGDHV